jgi:hypothetical protein
MAEGSSLENILASLQCSMWGGQVFRVMLNDYPPDRENTHGARWNPPDVAAIYTCLEPAVWIAEVAALTPRCRVPCEPASTPESTTGRRFR